MELIFKIELSYAKTISPRLKMISKIHAESNGCV